MKTVDREKLWESFSEETHTGDEEQIIIEYAPLEKLLPDVLVCTSGITWNLMIW